MPSTPMPISRAKPIASAPQSGAPPRGTGLPNEPSLIPKIFPKPSAASPSPSSPTNTHLNEKRPGVGAGCFGSSLVEFGSLSFFKAKRIDDGRSSWSQSAKLPCQLDFLRGTCSLGTLLYLGNLAAAMTTTSQLSLTLITTHFKFLSTLSILLANPNSTRLAETTALAGVGRAWRMQCVIDDPNRGSYQD